MSFYTILACIAIITIVSGHHPDSAKIIQELKDSGLSQDAITAIEDIGNKHKDEFKGARGNHEQMTQALKDLTTDIDAYMVTASETDQAAWKTFAEKKQAEFAAHQMNRTEETH